MNRIGRLVAAGAAVAALATSAVARAQTDEQCIAANESAVSLQKSGRLIEERQQLALCAAPACPDPVRTSCQDRLEQVNRQLPSVIFDVKDGRGNDLMEFRLSIDGVPYADNVRGTAIPLNPGNHEFRFEVAGQAPVVKQFLLHESEQYRRESIVIGPIPVAPTAQAAPPTSGTSLVLTPGSRLTVTGGAEAAPTAGRFQRTMGTLLLAAGLPAGIIATLAYGGVALAKWDNAKGGECDSTCNDPNSQAQRDLQDARNAATISTILAVATGAVLVGGIVLRVTAPTRPTTTPTVVPVAGPAGGGLLLQGGFQ
jgi:hypothetical protein